MLINNLVVHLSNCKPLSCNFLGQKATVEEIEDSPEMDNIQDYCKELTGARSVPRVWINRKFVGGADAVELAYKNGTIL